MQSISSSIPLLVVPIDDAKSNDDIKSNDNTKPTNNTIPIDEIFPSQFADMTDSTLLYKNGDYSGVWDNLSNDGFILIRGVIPDINKARTLIVNNLVKGSRGAIDTPDSRVVINKQSKLHKYFDYTIDLSTGVNITSIPEARIPWSNTVGTDDVINNTYNSSELELLCKHVLIGGNRNYNAKDYHCSIRKDHSWLRIRGVDGNTKLHSDYYYFRNNTTLYNDKHGQRYHTDIPYDVCYLCNKKHQKFISCDWCKSQTCFDCNKYLVTVKKYNGNVVKQARGQNGVYHCSRCIELDSSDPITRFPYYTAWICLDELTDGVLCLLPGSHKLTKHDQPLTKHNGHLYELPGSYQLDETKKWQIARTMKPGDVILFNHFTVHGALPNKSKYYRISCDIRIAITRKITSHYKRHKPFHIDDTRNIVSTMECAKRNCNKHGCYFKHS